MSGTLDFLLGGKTKKPPQFASITATATNNGSGTNTSGLKTVVINVDPVSDINNTDIKILQLINKAVSSSSSYFDSETESYVNYIKFINTSQIEMSAYVNAHYAGSSTTSSGSIKAMLEITEFE